MHQKLRYRLIFGLIGGILVFSSVSAQQSPSFTQYSQFKFLMNPAAAGSDGFTSVSLVAREEWLTIQGASNVHALTFDTRILGDSYILSKLPIRKKAKNRTRSGNTGAGGYFFSDVFGKLNRTKINGTYSYHINLGQNQLSLGLGLNYFQIKARSDEFVWGDDVPDDLDFSGSIKILDANFGLYTSSKNYYAGYSTLQLFGSSVQFGQKDKGKYKLSRQHNIMGGYILDINKTIDIEPMALIKMAKDIGSQLDVGVKASFERRYWVGMNIRTNFKRKSQALSFYGGSKFDNYYIGYAVDFNLNSVTANSFGTHELLFIARFGDSARRYRWLNTY